MKRIAALLLISVGVSGCVLNAETARLRAEFVKDTTKDLDSATAEAKAAFMKALEREANDKLGQVRAQYSHALLLLASNGILTAENAEKAGLKFGAERNRVEDELYTLARAYTTILKKIAKGSRALLVLDEVQAEAENIQRRLIIDIFTKDLPLVLGGIAASGNFNIDPEFVTALNGLIQAFDAGAPGLIIPAVKPAAEVKPTTTEGTPK